MFRKSVSEWTEKYGSVTVFSYMVYGELDDEEISTLGNGLSIFLIMEGIMPLFNILEEEIDTEQALAMNEYRGTFIQIVLPNSVVHLESLIKTVASDFFRMVALKNNYIKTERVINNA